jgi:hypothetical protein
MWIRIFFKLKYHVVNIYILMHKYLACHLAINNEIFYLMKFHISWFNKPCHYVD